MIIPKRKTNNSKQQVVFFSVGFLIIVFIIAALLVALVAASPPMIESLADLFKGLRLSEEVLASNPKAVLILACGIATSAVIRALVELVEVFRSN